LLAGTKLLLFSFPSSLRSDFFALLTDATLALLILIVAWRAARWSRPYARILWWCISFAALIWTLNFIAGAIGLMSDPFKTAMSARWPSLVISSFPFAIAFTLPLLFSEDRENPGVGWLQALDIAQFGIIVFSAFFVFFYVPSLYVPTDNERFRYLTALHVTRDSFLAAGYFYRGWRSRFPDLRRLHFRMGGFFVIYGLSVVVLSSTRGSSWHRLVLGLASDLAPLFLLVTAATWKQQEAVIGTADAPSRTRTKEERLLWMQALALIMPISVVVLAARLPQRYLRTAWIIVTVSFVCYAARLFMMQRRQVATLGRLAATEEKYSKAFKSSPAAITITRFSDGCHLEVNDRWLQLMNLTREQVIGKTSIELGVFANAEEREKMLAPLRGHGSVRGLNLKVRSRGRILDTLASAEVIELDGQRLIIASILDITEFKSLIEQLHHVQKMELVGSLAGGVAHDFNNLLTIITGYAALAEKRDLDPELADEIQQIKQAAGKASALTRQLLAFSRRQVLEPRNISLNRVIAEIERLLRRTIGENIQLRTVLAADLGTVHADPVQIEQVVMNLAVNARDAMPDGGKLLFETCNLDLTSPYPQGAFEIPAGRYVMLVITDTGTGIPPEHLDRIFEPFFTTKGVGKGTGLGLSTVYGIVKQSGGYLWAYSHLGAGTTFKICLPRVETSADSTRPAQTTENLRGTETVMVVDDDRNVCDLTAKILGQYGYRVITSHSGEEALQRADAFPAEIDLLVTDVIMQNMSGRELARQLKAKRPGLKLLYVSGYSHFSLSGENGVVFPGEMTLPKPFAPSDLAFQARRALRAAG
jgi:PAS domain S-box-containing protein